MNFSVNENDSINTEKTTEKENAVRSEESLTHAVTVLKSLSDWNKSRLLKSR